ncbi:hypothetical protein OE88DRAFT_1667110 [Heliocybe sulcata]|uniref:Uncharacterized protein n=1 Tax=Heliocybe sulcata TaxID=5364 RepID=A0A5C3MN53_9AGAM|nr:hypothetical protein OE88DRAFT_1667110 [Heliocybe sulcata]
MLLIIRTDNTTIGMLKPDPVIAQAIVDFQYKNAARNRLGLDWLDNMAVLAIYRCTRHSSLSPTKSQSLSDRTRPSIWVVILSRQRKGGVRIGMVLWPPGRRNGSS